jgi:hypothetical protein
MTDKSKTKLLKIVCENAELMRAPFRHSPWPSKINHTVKKPLSVNKTGEKFRSIKSNTTNYEENIASNSEGMYYRKIYSIFNDFFNK